MSKIVPVIMSGGAGTRLWPMSTKDRPKQMHRLFGDNSLLQTTALRVHENASFTAPIIVCAAPHAQQVATQMQEIGITPSAIIAEPCPRNTAPCAAIAAHAVKQIYGEDALVFLMAADHFVANRPAFQAAVIKGAKVAEDGKILTFGAKANRPETGYGYLLGGHELATGVLALNEFVEKPDLPSAITYLQSGEYYWNAGIFLYAARTMLEEMAALRPQIATASVSAWQMAIQKDGITKLDQSSFSDCPSESVDTAIMEETAKGALVPFDVGWSDVGSWTSIHEISDKDEQGNRVSGPCVSQDNQDCLLLSDGIQIAAAGVENLAIIAQGNSVLVLPLDQAQKVKDLVAALPDDKK